MTTWLIFFWSLFGAFTLTWFLLRIYLRRKDTRFTLQPSPEFSRFQRSYLYVCCSLYFADWLQSPYSYAVYQAYGYSVGDIAILFITSYISSTIFSLFVNLLIDKYGRRRFGLIYCALHLVSCLVLLSENFWVLLCGRLVSGIAVTILWSTFETWLVSQHIARGFPSEWLSNLISLTNFLNYFLAVLAGLVSSVVVSRFEYNSPFLLSTFVLFVPFFVIYFTWTENFGDSSNSFMKGLYGTLNSIRNDWTLLLLGIIQTIFEASISFWMFSWTPILHKHVEEFSESENGLEGLVFASYMTCSMIGSSIFSLLSNHFRAEEIYKFNIFFASLSFFFGAIQNGFTAFIAFSAFQVCSGIHFPCVGYLWSKYIPDENRGTFTHFFRIPTTLVVIILLYLASIYTWAVLYLICGVGLFIAMCLQFIFSVKNKKDLVISSESDWLVH
eukprot:TRINITY_DN6890_c0_g1_i4.p1 TRINITY_DN6890_c0_g1~~TRINITY_DN6890_c0_g1_i4.p1  ORF type:complete len:442 (-),score=45.21 TRINITY_DN6890_c0_g1_i4:159-1484(-)